MIRVIHFRARCIGCFACVEASPDRWRMNRADGRSVLIGGIAKRDHFVAAIGDDEHEANQIAAENCPVGIIQVIRKA